MSITNYFYSSSSSSSKPKAAVVKNPFKHYCTECPKVCSNEGALKSHILWAHVCSNCCDDVIMMIY